MQNAGLQYGQDSSIGVATLQNATASSTASLRQFRKKEAEKTPQLSSDVDVTTSSKSTTTTSQNSSHVARVAPHNHYPPHLKQQQQQPQQQQQQQQPDYYRYHAHSHPHHQYTPDYTPTPFKERTVKYSEIAEISPHSHHAQHLVDPNLNSAHLSQQQQVRQFVKKSDKNIGLGGEYAATVAGDSCNLATPQQALHYNQQQQPQQSYHQEMALHHHQYLQKEPQMHFAPYKTESHHHQYIPAKESGAAAVGATTAVGHASSLNAAAAFLKYSSNIPQRNYMGVVDAAASHHYGRMEAAAHPGHAFRDYSPADYVSTSMDQGRMYAAAVAAQKQRYYAAPNAVAAPSSSYPPSPSHNYSRNIQQPFNYTSSCSYPPSRPPPSHHQMNRYTSHPHQQPVLSPPPPQVLRRSAYHHPISHHHLNHHQDLMEMNYAGSSPSVQKIPPTYYHPQSGAYAQHYQQQQQRRGVAAPPPPSTHHNIQDYYHPHAPPHLGAGVRTYHHATSAAMVEDDVDEVDNHGHIHHAQLASNNIRQYLENWAEEESNIPEVATETTPATRRNNKFASETEPDDEDEDDDEEEVGGAGANEVYVINASELPQYLENGQYIFKSNVTLDVNALKILEKSSENTPQNNEERIVSLHIVENPALNGKPTSNHVVAAPSSAATSDATPTIVEDLDKIVQDTLTSQLNDLEKLEENLKIPDDLNLDAEEEEIMDLSTRRSESRPVTDEEEEDEGDKVSVITKNMPSLIDEEEDRKLDDVLEEKLRELTKDEDTKESQDEETKETEEQEEMKENDEETVTKKEEKKENPNENIEKQVEEERTQATSGKEESKAELMTPRTKKKKIEETAKKRKRRIFSVDDIINRIGSSIKRRAEEEISDENRESTEENMEKFKEELGHSSEETTESLENLQESNNSRETLEKPDKSPERTEEASCCGSSGEIPASNIEELVATTEKINVSPGCMEKSPWEILRVTESTGKVEEFTSEIMGVTEEPSEEKKETFEKSDALSRETEETKNLEEARKKNEESGSPDDECLNKQEESIGSLEIPKESTGCVGNSTEILEEKPDEMVNEEPAAENLEEKLGELTGNTEETSEITKEALDAIQEERIEEEEEEVSPEKSEDTLVNPEDSSKNLEDIEKMLEKLEETSSIERKLEELVGSDVGENLEELEEDVQYRNVLKIEENNVLLEICGELVELSVNILNGKKIIQISSISSSTTTTTTNCPTPFVDHNDNLETFQSLETTEDSIAMPILENETEKPGTDAEELEELPILDKMIEEQEEDNEELVCENEIIIGEDESLEEEVNLDLEEKILEEEEVEKPKVCTKAAKKSYEDEIIEENNTKIEKVNDDINKKKKRRIPKKKDLEARALKELMERRRIRKETLRLKEKKKKIEHSTDVPEPETLTSPPIPPIESKKKLSIQEYNNRKRNMAPSTVITSLPEKRKLVVTQKEEEENSRQLPKKTSSIYASEKRLENSKDPRRRMEDQPSMVTSTKLPPLPLVTPLQRMTSSIQQPSPVPPPPQLASQVASSLAHRHAPHSSSLFRKKVQFDDNVQINEINTTETKTAKKKKKGGDENFCEVSSSSEKTFAAANDWEEEEEQVEGEEHRKRRAEEDLIENVTTKKKKNIIIDINDLVKELSRKKDEDKIKNEIDAKLNELNIEIPKKKKINGDIEDDLLMRKFLRKDKLNTEEIQKIRRIIYLKKKIQQISHPPRKKKKKRFRNLYADTSPDSSEVEMPEFSVTKEENFRGVKLIFKRKIFNLQPIVKLQRCDDLIEKF